MSDERQSLEKTFTKGDILALGFGAMIGWGWVMLSGLWVEQGGWGGAIIAFLIGALMCVFVGLCYAELTPALPCADGGMVFTYRGMGYTSSWMAIWSTCFAYVGVAAWEGIAIATAINYVLPIPKIGYLWTIAGYDVYFSWCAIGMVVAVILTLVNLKGKESAALFQKIATVGLTLVGIVFVCGGVTLGSVEHMGPVFKGAKGIVAVLLMTPAMFVGFDVIPQSAEEMNIPRKQIGKILIMSIFMATFWYLIMCIGVAMAAPSSVRVNGAVPVADAAAFVFGNPIMGKIVIVGALCGILTSWNGFIVGGARVLFAMGRAKMLPPIFGKISKNNAPYAAIILIGIICVLSPLMGENALVWFVNASAFGTVITYLFVSIAFLRIRKQEPDLERPFKVKNYKLVGWGAILISVAFIMLYLPGSPSALVWPYEWGMILAWCVLGLVLAAMTKKSYPNMTMKERELLIFGEEYGRADILEGKLDKQLDNQLN